MLVDMPFESSSCSNNLAMSMSLELRILSKARSHSATRTPGRTPRGQNVKKFSMLVLMLLLLLLLQACKKKKKREMMSLDGGSASLEDSSNVPRYCLLIGCI
jgi:hypothetical protein